MLKKIVTYILWTLMIAVFGCYFYFASTLSAQGRRQELCSDIQVTILDSAVNNFITKQDVVDIIKSSDINPIAKEREWVDLPEIEELLEHRSAIRKSDAYIGTDGILHVEVSQRRPILRIQTAQGGFYIDDSQYIFPLVSTFTSYVPIITGNIPVRLQEGFRGEVYGDEKMWLDDIIRLAEYLDRHPFWNAQIQQINVENNGDFTFYTAVGDQKIIFGGLDNLDYKFAKLKTYYDQIVPIYGWEKYDQVNLKFSDQIVCTKRKISKKSSTI